MTGFFCFKDVSLYGEEVIFYDFSCQIVIRIEDNLSCWVDIYQLNDNMLIVVHETLNNSIVRFLFKAI